MKEIETASLCPVCRKRVPAEYTERKDGVYLVKTCAEHGAFECLVWAGKGFNEWCDPWMPDTDSVPDCPDNCGLCAGHKNNTCCTILEITEKCNLSCPFCFADGGKGEHMPFDKAKACIKDIYAQGRRYIHFGGGEPTIHPDILGLIAHAKAAGLEYIQLNTNGLMLANEPDFARKCKEAGASCVFLQFDGTTDEIYEQTRGTALLDAKLRAIENCDKAELGVILVPTLIPGINDDNIGEMIRFGAKNMPAVRGIHFQPVAYTGRYEPGRPHMTTPELLNAIEEQSYGMIRKADISPSSCDAPLCGFHAEYRKKDGVLKPISSRKSCCCGAADVSYNQRYVLTKWTRVADGSYEPDSMDAVLKSLSDSTFCISAMSFMDLDTIDLSRTMQCSISIYDSGKFIPLCNYNILWREPH